jgi:hypothetical protein
MSNMKLKYEKPMAVDAGALSQVHGAYCTSGFEANDGCNTTGNYAAECGFGYNNGVQTICDSTGNEADNDCVSDGSSAGGSCSADGSSPGSCSAGDSPDGTPCIGDGSTASFYCNDGSGA